MHIPFYKRILSFIIPITLQKSIGTQLSVLYLQLYRNHLILGTNQAIYSYGLRYNPFTKTFALLHNELKKVDSFLLLGTGLGSALYILQQKYKRFPNTTCIDNDEEIIKFSKSNLNLNARNNVQWICTDVRDYLETVTQKFDLIGVDIFKDLVVPHFITKPPFIIACKNVLRPNGICIFNLIFKHDTAKQNVEKLLNQHFARVKRIDDKTNTYFICFV